MKPRKCNVCSKKLSSLLIQMHTCRCKNEYCSLHMHDHKCPYDYSIEKIRPEKVTNDKIDKI